MRREAVRLVDDAPWASCAVEAHGGWIAYGSYEEMLSEQTPDMSDVARDEFASLWRSGREPSLRLIAARTCGEHLARTSLSDEEARDVYNLARIAVRIAN